MNRKECKQLAKQILKGKWVIAFAAVLIYSAVSAAVGTITLGIGILLLSASLMIALYNVFIGGYKENKYEISDMVKGATDNISTKIVLSILKTIFLVLWSLLFVVPGIIKAYSYAMALYILVEDPSKSINKCISESQDMMNGYKMYYFVLQCGFGVIGVVITLVTAITIIMLNSMAITIPALCVMGLVLITLNEVACAHFYLKILSKQTYSEIYGGNSIKDIQDKENSAKLI